MEMRVKLDDGAYMPTRAHATDAGLDLRTPESFTLYPDFSIVVNTGVHVELPPGHCGLLVSKSGLNTEYGITSTGLIDEGYTGPIKVKLYNQGKKCRFEAGDKISQLVVLPCRYVEPIKVDELKRSHRGNDGFGSTGR